MNKQDALNRLTALEQEAKALREIIEAPEPAGSLLPQNWGRYSCSMITGAFPAEELRDWVDAIDTLIELRRQPGTEKPSNKAQYRITTEIVVAYGTVRADKLARICPCFATYEQAEAAIEKIGADRLTQMFNTLHGVEQ